MNFDPPIKAEWFYTNENEKTKINWFCFEYALEVYSFLIKSEDLKKYCSRTSDEEIAAFCAYFSKRMKKSVYDRLTKITSVVIIDDDYVTDYYPEKSQSQITNFMKVAEEAWDSLLSVCEVCPVRCISERERKSEFFDRYRIEAEKASFLLKGGDESAI